MNVPALLLAAAFLIPQDRPPVEELLAKIDRKDSAASFRAIADLVALPREHRPAIEEGAAKLEPFYREALLSELRVKDRLGDLFGRDLRVTLKSDKRMPSEHLSDLEKPSGMKFALQPQDPMANPPEPFAVDFANIPIMSALAEVCEKADCYTMAAGMDPQALTLYPRASKSKPFCYRNFALFPTDAWKEKRIDFTGRAPWTCRLSCNVVWDPGVRVTDWKPEARLIEATSDQGRALEAAATSFVGAFRDQDEPVTTEALPSMSVSVSLRMPAEKPEKIARLRFVATALIPRTTREFLLTTERAKAEDDLFEASLHDTEGGGGYPVYVLTLRPKKTKAADLANLPVRVKPKIKEWGDCAVAIERDVRKESVEYRITCYTTGPVVNPVPPQAKPTLEKMTVSLALELVERPVYVELADIPLK